MDLFNCQAGEFPIRYLGVLVSPSKLHIKDWIPLQEKNEKKKLSIWRGISLSIAGRATMINSSLTSTFIYHMSMYLFPKTIIQNLDRQRRSFFWQGGGTKRKYHLIRWSTITLSKKDGGLGIKDSAKMNVSLLCKWWWRLEHESGIWQEIIQVKYLHGKPVGVVHHRLNDSPIWTDLLKVK